MKFLVIAVVLCSVLGSIYFGEYFIRNKVEQRSAEIIEETLSSNTIANLQMLTNIQRMINNGQVEDANKKLDESINTLKYILKNNCKIEKCKEALSSY